MKFIANRVSFDDAQLRLREDIHLAESRRNESLSTLKENLKMRLRQYVKKREERREKIYKSSAWSSKVIMEPVSSYVYHLLSTRKSQGSKKLLSTSKRSRDVNKVYVIGCRILIHSYSGGEIV